MFVVNSLPVAIIFCVITMLGWGSWDNTQKLAGKEKWPFQLFYWDYAIGVFLFSLVFSHTLGSFGAAGPPPRENPHPAKRRLVFPARVRRVFFNLFNPRPPARIPPAVCALVFRVWCALSPLVPH